MKDFEYLSPTSISQAVALLSEKGERARVLAGGTDLIVQLRGGRFELDRVVDGKEIPELNRIDFDLAQGLMIGAAVPCYRIYENDVVIDRYPGLKDAAEIIGGIQIQGRASLGGNLCNASPSGDTIPALIVLEAIALVAGPSGDREVPVEEFCIAPGRSVLAPGELLVSFLFPDPGPRSGSRYLRFIPRNEMDIAIVGAGASVTLSEDLSTFVKARIALGAVAPTPLYVPEAGAALVGKPVNEDSIALAAEAAREAARPIDDMRGSTEQRKHLSAVLTARALRDAVARARGETVHVH